MSTILKTLSAATFAGLISSSSATAEVSEHFIIHTLEQTPQEAATLIRDFIAMNDDWSLNGDFEMMGGAAVGMKICFNAMRGYVAAAGLHNLALMPCGNIAFYDEDGQSYLSMLLYKACRAPSSAQSLSALMRQCNRMTALPKLTNFRFDMEGRSS